MDRIQKPWDVIYLKKLGKHEKPSGHVRLAPGIMAE
jgi:hypothetical protein